MKSIVVAVDFSNATPEVLRQAGIHARCHGAQLRLIHVIEPEPSYAAYGLTPAEFPSMHEYQREAKRLACEKLNEMAKEISMGNPDASVHIAEGSPLRCIEDYVAESEADLLVLGSHGHGAIASLLLGSVAEGMVRRAKVPTLVVPAAPED